MSGSADHPLLLHRANLAQARMLVVAVPDAVTARRIVDQAQQMVPRLAIVVRTHSEAEREWHMSRGVTETIHGERELALEMARFALHRFGVPSLETSAIVQRIRRSRQSNAPDTT